MNPLPQNRGMNDLSTERLARLVAQKRQVLEQLRTVAARQGELLTAGDSGELLRLLSAKQQLMAGLQKVERMLAPFRDQDPARRDWPTPAARAACADDAQACARLLTEVLELEHQHERIAADSRDRVGAQLRTAHASQQAATAYRGASRPARPIPAPHTGAPPATGIDLATG